MDLSAYKNLLATSAVIFTILQFLSGVLVCLKFIKKGHSDDVSVLPFIAGFLSNTIWSRYGQLTGDRAVLIVNTTGTLLMMTYTITHYLYTTRKKPAFRKVVIVTVITTIIQILASLEEDREFAKKWLGCAGCFMSICFLGAPLVNLNQVLKSRCSDSLPFPMILTAFSVTAQWTLYGYIIEDGFLIYPNLLGWILSAFQLSLFLVFPSKSKSSLPLRMPILTGAITTT